MRYLRVEKVQSRVIEILVELRDGDAIEGLAGIRLAESMRWLVVRLARGFCKSRHKDIKGVWLSARIFCRLFSSNRVSDPD